MTVRSRPQQALPYVLAFVLGLTAAGLAACASKTNPAMIPAANATELKDRLDAVLAAVESKECPGAQRAVDQVRADLESLPSGTSQRLQERLQEGVDRLAEQAAEECQASETTDTATTETVTTETTTTAVETTPTTETVPTTPTTATTPTTTPTTTTPHTETTPPSLPTPEETGGEAAP